MVKRLFFLMMFSVLVSCEPLTIAADPEPDATLVFEHLWQDVKERYSFFELKNLDWEEVATNYRPRVKDDMGQVELFELLAEMLFELQDGHVNLTNSFNRSRNWEWFEGFPINYNEQIIAENYLGTDFWISGPLRHQEIGEALYVYYGSFAQTVTLGNIQAMVARARGKKGLIIDVRNNGGGSLSNAERLAGVFVEEEVTYAKQRTKNGPGLSDFGPWKEMSFSPLEEALRFNGPVVILTNRSSFSATTFFAQMMKTVPNAILLGDQTGGGGGTPVFGELPNGWTYRFSATQTIDLEGRQLEDGVLVDIREDMNRTSEIQGRDSILDRALNLIQNL